jgi:two-component system OmpR family response regulator
MRLLPIELDAGPGAAVHRRPAGDDDATGWVQELDAAADARAVATFDRVLPDLMLPDGRGVPFLRRLQGAARHDAGNRPDRA